MVHDHISSSIFLDNAAKDARRKLVRIHAILPLCFNTSMIGGFTVPSATSQMLPPSYSYRGLIHQVIHIQWGLRGIFSILQMVLVTEEWNFLFLGGRGA
jgi:hypothetical protein